MSTAVFFTGEVIYELQVIWSFTAVRQFPGHASLALRTHEKVEACLYGAYFVLMTFYLYVLHTRGVGKQRRLAGATMALFILCTVHFALVLGTTVLATKVYITEPLPDLTISSVIGRLTVASNAVYVTTNVIADIIFTFRCYAIWNFRLSIVLLPILGILFVPFLALVVPYIVPNARQEGFFTVSVVVSLLTTFILTALTVGRIWWLARDARHVMVKSLARKYHTVCAMILESGALYLLGGLIFVLLNFERRPITLPSIQAGAALGQLVGIAPTIIAVRVGLGYSVESLDSFIAPEPRWRRDHVSTSSPDAVLHIPPESVKVESV
ncbi:hypothetical protein DFH08DRAFT_1081181 [Mycena albidolilacea]|uniref:Uncharacterized protein n=1 Tax=Mycena albidolilacea TaxID=1033008 RepID=A0AAD6ZZ94_9AGAR|nr:hypothetical protein DFH08DRAFT_1081181 [Mycena albidolilacea]